jgi:hypothetical protein
VAMVRSEITDELQHDDPFERREVLLGVNP